MRRLAALLALLAFPAAGNSGQREAKLRWSAQDVEDVVQYLRETRHRF